MINKISKILENKALSIDEIIYKLDLDKSNDFVCAVKVINEMIDKGICFELEDKIYLSCKYLDGIVRKKKEGYFVDDIEIINYDDFYLFDGDEIIYQINKYMMGVCIKIKKRKIIYVFGTIEKRKNTFYFYSDEYRFMDYKIVNFKDYSICDGLRLRCYISDYFKKELKIDKIIGHKDDKEILIKQILLTNDAPISFSNNVINECKSINDEIKTEDRKDLRELAFVTIDGEDAKDFDDAIYVKREDEGYRIYVSIADVSYYVKEDSFIDLEAYQRGTSIYYHKHVIPMLPEILCNDLCSLKENCDRYTITCEMMVGFDGEVINYDIYPSIIRNKHRMTYNQVNKILGHDKELLEKYNDIKAMLYTSYEASRIVDKTRMNNGGIEFETSEPIFIEENGKVVDIAFRKIDKAEEMIEDFMILANTTIASYMYYLGYPLVYRNHDYLKIDKFENFINFVNDLGYHFKNNNYNIKSKELAKCLETFKDDERYPLISEMLLKSMSKALYESTCRGHYGLGLEHYCHFTSPIRRYPDLLVHRMIKKYIFNGKVDEIDLDNNALNEKVKLCNENEKKAVNIERNVADLKRAEYMQDKLYQSFDATITSIFSYGFYVSLNNTVEGLVHINTFVGFYDYVNGKITNGIEEYKVGQKVKVRLIGVDLLKRTIDFEIC